jgi:hypothetical protein
MPKANGLRERAADGEGVRAVSRSFPGRFSGRVNAETPPFWGGVSDAAGEPDDYLLSHG